MRYSRVLLAVMLSWLPSNAHAVVIATFNGMLDTSRPVHLIFTGYSHGVGLQFVESAIAQGRRYHELYPDHEVVFVRNNETGSETDANELEGLGLKIVTRNSEVSNGLLVIKLARMFPSVASLEFFSHSSIHAGAGLESSAERFNVATPGINKLYGHFTRDGYVFFHGCNTGFFQAPELSKKIGVPVYGALTSTDFHALQNDGSWKLYDLNAFPAGSWATENTISYESSVSCRDGACLRLSPDNAPYDGVWGHYEGGGLPFFKAFCTSDMSESDCSRVMATALLGYPSIRPLTAQSSTDDFIAVAEDFLCPTDSAHRDECVNALNASLVPGASEVYSSFEGNTLDCDYRTCNVTWQCQYDPSGNAISGSCSVDAPHNDRPVTMVQEFKRYINGAALLSR